MAEIKARKRTTASDSVLYVEGRGAPEDDDFYELTILMSLGNLAMGHAGYNPCNLGCTNLHNIDL